MKDYWDKRFQDEGKIWGEAPSKSATYALELFRKNGLHKILVPGAGYGRNTKLFSAAGFEVDGIEISDKAIEIAKGYDTQSKFCRGSVLDVPFDNEKYDAVYCFNVLHLFHKSARKLLLDKCARTLRKSAFVFFTVFSEREKSFGKGREVEKNTFESKPGRPVHYFTEEDLLEHFREYNTIETGLIEEAEDHGREGPHTHVLRYIFSNKVC